MTAAEVRRKLDAARIEVLTRPGERFDAPARVQRLADTIVDLANLVEALLISEAAAEIRCARCGAVRETGAVGFRMQRDGTILCGSCAGQEEQR